MAVAYEATVDVGEAIRASASALELKATGFSSDVDVELDVDAHVAVLADGAFTLG
jgi:hypothetical protein